MTSSWLASSWKHTWMIQCISSNFLLLYRPYRNILSWGLFYWRPQSIVSARIFTVPSKFELLNVLSTGAMIIITYIIIIIIANDFERWLYKMVFIPMRELCCPILFLKCSNSSRDLVVSFESCRLICNNILDISDTKRKSQGNWWWKLLRWINGLCTLWDNQCGTISSGQPFHTDYIAHVLQWGMASFASKYSYILVCLVCFCLINCWWSLIFEND